MIVRRPASRPYWRRLAAAAVAVLSCATANAGASEAYGDLPGSKALAAIPGQPASISTAHSQPNDLLAALTALRRCEEARSIGSEACELLQLNDEVVTSGADIRATATTEEAPHPLFLWRLDGPEATVYLAGSVHILKPSLYPLPAPYDAAFATADKLVLEVNVGAQDPMELQRKTMAYAALPPDQRISDVLPEALLAGLETSLARYGIPLAQVATVKPAFLMNQVVLLRLITLGYQAEHGVEQHYLQQLGNREILELETLDAQLALLFDQPMDLQRQLLADTLDQEPDIEPLVAAMIGAWFSGDEAEFMAMFEAQSGDSALARRFTEQLLDERNEGMVDGIVEFLAGEGTYFVLVGAAHLIGEKGIIALLEEAGIEAEQLYSDSVISAGQTTQAAAQ